MWWGFLGHEITLKILEFLLNSIEKLKSGFLLSSICKFPKSNETKFWSHSFHIQNSGISIPEWIKGGTPLKWILTIFICKNEFFKQLGLKKQKKKIWLFVWFSCLIPELRSLNCEKMCSFCNFWPMSAKNLRLLKQLLYMHLKVDEFG